MRKLSVLTLCAALSCFGVLGCTDAQQVEDAQEDLVEEQNETAEEIGDAMEDGLVTEDEAEEITEEQGETIGAAGELAEQEGELIEEQAD